MGFYDEVLDFKTDLEERAPDLFERFQKIESHMWAVEAAQERLWEERQTLKAGLKVLFRMTKEP